MHPRPHPNLTAPSLFIGHLPNHVRDEHLDAHFKSSQPDIVITCTGMKNVRFMAARNRVDFPDINSAEKALAIFHLQPIPGVDPPVILQLFITIGLEPLEAPDSLVAPRLIKGLLPGLDAEQALYDTLRPYGPIHSVRIDPIVGGMVQFWNESHAREAETGLATPGRKGKLVLEAYDPCSLVCSNLSFDLEPAALLAHFSRCYDSGSINSIEILPQFHSGKSRGLAFVSFDLAAQAHATLQAMHGVEIEDRRIAVTYRIFKKDKKSDSGATQTLEPVDVESSVQEDSASSVGESVPVETTKTLASPDASFITPPETPDLETADSTRSELESLQDLFHGELQERLSVQAENETLHKELDALKHALELAESKRLSVQAESEALLLAQAENDILHTELEALRRAFEFTESNQLLVRAEKEILREELEAASRARDLDESRRLLVQAENEALHRELEAAKRALELDESRRLSVQAENETLHKELEAAKRALEFVESRLEVLQLAESRLKMLELDEPRRRSVQTENETLHKELEAVKCALELAESRLKMLELERDRPLWEEAKAKRKAAEEAARAKEEARRKAAEVEESRRKMEEFAAQERERKRAAEEAERKERLRREAEEKTRREREERERLAREKEERERKVREARERRDREQRWRSATTTEEARCRDRDNGMWGQGQWTVARALQRLKFQMDEFEKLKFSETQPLTFAVIPWPVLADPVALDIEEVTWSAVEAFFERVRVPAGLEYNGLVERVHRLFHPDKWKARGILGSVMDEETRSSLETAGNTVAQAMTPLWRKSKGYA